MKKLLFLASFLSMSCLVFSQLDQIIVDKIVHSETEGEPTLAGQTTYRVYAQLQNSDDQVSNIQGQNLSPLDISTTTQFYRLSPTGSVLGEAIDPFLFNFVPASRYNSTVTIGRVNAENLGVPTASNPLGETPNPGNVANLFVAEDNTSPWISNFAAGNDIIINSVVGGGWLMPPGDQNPPIGTEPFGLNGFGTDANNSVLLGQFTTDGDFSFNINVVIFPGSGGFIEYFHNVDTGLGLSFDSTDCGCTDPTACNYNADPNTIEDGSCIYADALLCEACSGETDGTGTVQTNDADGDGVCDGDEVAGCQDITACNYNAAATDAAPCVFPTGCETCSGETDGTGTVVDNDDDNDGVCNADEVAGCQDISACNYNAAATDAAPCVFPTGCETCSGETDGTGTVVDNDDDNDGVCNADEVAGCQDITACNYNAAATDAAPCVFPTGCETCSGETDGTGTVVDNDDDNDGVCNADEVAGCQDISACNYNAAATDAAPCVFPTGCETCSGETDGTGTVVDNDDDNDGVCNADEVAGCQDITACNYNAAATDAAPCVFPTGCETCSGETDGTGTVVDNDDDNDGVCNADEVEGCQDITACNYNTAATDAAPCVFPTGCETCSGETDGTGTVVDNDDDNDGVCNADEVAGCQDITACNYNAAATDAAPCVFPTGCETCSGETDGTGTVVDNDDDNDGVCNADEVEGCQDITACNYNTAATDAAPCVFPTGCETCSGETDGTGTVVDNDDDNDGVCNADEVAGCQDITACNYNAAATDAAPCVFPTGCETCSGETDGTGTVVDNDDDNDGVCNADEVEGCQDITACNYNTAATDAAPCVFPTGCETCSGETDGTGTVVDNDDDNDGVCNADEVAGCQDITACNYNDAATDAGPCTFAEGCDTCSGETDGTGTVVDNPEVGEACDDGDENTFGDVIQENCECLGIEAIPGCLNPEASNFNNNANTDDGSCLFLCDADPVDLLDVTNFTSFDDGSGNSFGSPSSMGLLAGGINLFGGHLWNVNTAGLATSDFCISIDYTVTGEPAAFPKTLEFRIENNTTGDWNHFNLEVTEPGTYTLGGIVSTGTQNGAGFNPDGVAPSIVAAIAYFPGDGTVLPADITVEFSNLCVSTDCGISGCTDEGANNYNVDADTDDGSCLYDVTFNVNMNCFDGNDPDIEFEGDGTFTTPAIESPLFGFCGSCVEMADPDMDGIWSVTIELPAGVFEYKYAHDGFLGQEQLVDDMVNGASCAPVTDFVNFANRQLLVGAGAEANDVYGTCGECNPGCTDEAALNFDPTANFACEDCCEFSPANDDCENAEALAIGQTVTGTTEGAAPTDPSATGNPLSPDVWYSFVGTGGLVDLVISLNGTMTDSYIALYDACGGTVLDANDDANGLASALTGVCAEAGVTYFVEVQGFGFTGGSVGSFDLSLTESTIEPDTYCSDETAVNFEANPGACDVADDTLCEFVLIGCTDLDAINYDPLATDPCEDCCEFAPNNDLCEDATSLTVDGDIVSGDNTNASDENDSDNGGSGEAEDIDPSCWGTDGDDGDVWFSFEGTGGLVDINTDLLDTQIAVYDACGGNLLDCDDDSGTGTLFSSLIEGLCTEIGVTYYIEVEGWSGTTGAFTIAVTTSEVLPDTYCSDENAVNFEANPGACDIADDTTCIINGCTDVNACNYNSAATDDDDSCQLPAGCETCSGETDGTGTVVDNDDDGDGICNDDEIDGCTDENAINFDPTATDDDGSCIDPVLGCTYAFALNFNPEANVDDGSCEEKIEGCTDPEALNFNPDANFDDNDTCIYSCSSCAGDFDGDGFVSVVDLSGFLAAFGLPCSTVD